MKIQPMSVAGALPPSPVAPALTKPKTADDSQLRKTFDTFVGEVYFGQMLKAMRSTVGEPAYFHGGQAEEIFQGQLDQILTEKMTAASAAEFAGPMFNLFNLPRS